MGSGEGPSYPLRGGKEGSPEGNTPSSRERGESFFFFFLKEKEEKRRSRGEAIDKFLPLKEEKKKDEGRILIFHTLGKRGRVYDHKGGVRIFFLISSKEREQGTL